MRFDPSCHNEGPIRLRAATRWAQSHIRLHCLAKIRSNQFSNRGLEQDGSRVIIMIWRAGVQHVNKLKIFHEGDGNSF